MSILDTFGERETHDPEDAIRDLIERRFEIQEMQKTEGWKYWSDFLIALSSAYQERLLQARHEDLLAQRRDAGVVEGIRIALTTIDRLDSRIASMQQRVAEARIADLGDLHEHA